MKFPLGKQAIIIAMLISFFIPLFFPQFKKRFIKSYLNTKHTWLFYQCQLTIGINNDIDQIRYGMINIA